MTFAKITATESPAMPLSNISNLPLTPERARRWSDTTHRVLSDLQTGTRACHMIIGEDVESEDLMNRQDKINDAKIQVVQRELITEVCTTSTSVIQILINISSVIKCLDTLRQRCQKVTKMLWGATTSITGFLKGSINC
jgi:hypothetical protein